MAINGTLNDENNPTQLVVVNDSVYEVSYYYDSPNGVCIYSGEYTEFYNSFVDELTPLDESIEWLVDAHNYILNKG
tara:strand:+ start:1463 stop:1690 length:228 start_codon:yes stop_codon:yes gene_type:complete